MKLYKVEQTIVAYVAAEDEAGAHREAKSAIVGTARLVGQLGLRVSEVMPGDTMAPPWTEGALVYHSNDHLESIEISTLWPDLGGWTSDFESFEDLEGYEYESDCAFVLYRGHEIVAYVQTGSGGYDRAHVFGPGVELEYSAELNEEDDPEWTMCDSLLTVARRWCEARLAEMDGGEK